MAQINKLMRDRYIKQVSRKRNKKPAGDKINPQVVPKVQHKTKDLIEQKETIVNNTPPLPFQAAKKATIAAIRSTKNISESSDKPEDQEAIERIESFGKDVISDTTDTVLETNHFIRHQIRKKRPDIRNTKDIKTATKTIKKADKTVKSTTASAVPTVKSSTESFGITVKSSTESACVAVRSTTETARQAAITSQKIATARKAERLAQKTAEWAKKIVKEIIEGIKKLCSSLSAASVPLVLILVLASAIAALIASAFGIFFTGDASAEGSKTLQEVILEINQEYTQYIEDIKESVTYDELVMEGYQSSWKDVLAIYAVYVTTKDDGATDVVHMTDENAQILYDIFWSMNTITYTTEERTVTEKVPDLDEDGNQKTDDDGNPLYVEQEKTIITLHIVQDHVTAAEQAEVMYFDDTQKAELAELLDPKYDSLWAELLKGIGQGSNELVNLALSQLGNEGGEKFWRWAGLSERCEWCALFVSWCGDQTGLRSSGQIPFFSFVSDGVDWFKSKGKWIDGSEINSSNVDKRIYPGMIIFFDWEPDGKPNHVGIVTKVSDGYIYTVEGNRGDAVAEGTYIANSSSIYGFGIIG